MAKQMRKHLTKAYRRQLLVRHGYTDIRYSGGEQRWHATDLHGTIRCFDNKQGEILFGFAVWPCRAM